jgi:hypothetical protein
MSYRYRHEIAEEALLRFAGVHSRSLETPTPLAPMPPLHPLPPLRRRLARHVRRHAGNAISVAFWILAGIRSIHQRSLKPLYHRAIYRGIVNMLRR